jgi:hypothetical protein
MTICGKCGWEITNTQWYNRLDKDNYICNDCEADEAVDRYKEMIGDRK